MRWFVVASVAVWSASALAADVSDGGVIPLPPVVVPLGAADIPNASSPTQRDPSATTTAIETKSRPVNAELTAETAFADLKNVMEFVLNADAAFAEAVGLDPSPTDVAS